MHNFIISFNMTETNPNTELMDVTIFNLCSDTGHAECNAIKLQINIEKSALDRTARKTISKSKPRYCLLHVPSNTLGIEPQFAAVLATACRAFVTSSVRRSNVRNCAG